MPGLWSAEASSPRVRGVRQLPRSQDLRRQRRRRDRIGGVADPRPVALDAFGGDNAPDAILDGAALALSQGVPVLLVGDTERLRGRVPKGAEVVHAPEIVAMDEPATSPLRKKPNSSIRRIFELLRDGKVQAAVTCGHSGAALAAAQHVLGMLPGVDRAPLCTVVPRRDGGQLVLLDLGANVDCKPQHLAQFAVLGDAYARAVLKLEQPRVGLLANGEERGKGNTQVRAAYGEIEALDLAFVGNIEPLGALRGECDVLVCDGFVGNVMLKTVEGTIEVAGHVLREELRRRPDALMGRWLLAGAFRRFRQRTTYDSVGGAILLGVDGVAVVGHGRADARAVASALRYARSCAGAGLVAAVRKDSTRLLTRA
ncbi:MAG: phosphate acyltransferase PlsX [Myxococcales bacterium]|nr:phosphate acyltransferase PlsX [Myxococcales bacterium]